MLPSFPGHARDHTTASPLGVVTPGVSSDVPQRFRSVSGKPENFRFSSTAGAPKLTAGAPTVVGGAPKLIAGAPTINEGAPTTVARAPATTDRAPPPNGDGLGL